MSQVQECECGCLTGFNSATAATPWMSECCRLTVTRSWVGFNSATAATPWMKAEAAAPRKPGRGFNSATAATPWMKLSRCCPQQRVKRLQFGHGGNAVDDER